MTRLSSIFSSKVFGGIFSKGKQVLPLFLFGSVVVLSSVYFFSKLVEFRVPLPGSDTAVYWYLGKVFESYGFLTSQIKYYFFSPLYALLFTFFSFTENSISTACLFSCAAFLFSGVIFYFLVEALFDSVTAFVSTFLFYAYKPFIFYALLPIKTMLFILLTILFFFIIWSAIEKSRNWLFFIAGIFSGLSFNLEGLFLPIFLTVVVFYLVFRKLSVKNLLFLILGFYAGLFPFGFRSYLVTGSFQYSPSLSGIHLYIGNAPGANGVYKKVKGIRPNAFGHFFDAKLLAERKLGEKLNPSEVNSFWIKKSITLFKKEYKRVFHLFLRKLLLSINDFEIPNNFNIYVISQKILLLKYNPFSFSILFSLGVAGSVLYLLLNRKLTFLHLLIITYPFYLSLFFITSRYRIIYAVFLLPFAGYFIVQFFKLKNVKHVFVSACAGILAFSLSKTTLFSSSNVKFVNSNYERKLRYAEVLDKIDREYKYVAADRRKRLLLKKAGLFYRVKMKEIGAYIREEVKKTERGRN